MRQRLPYPIGEFLITCHSITRDPGSGIWGAIEVDAERLDLAITHLEDLGNMALERGTTGRLKLISGQSASLLPLHKDVLDLQRLHYRVEAPYPLEAQLLPHRVLDWVGIVGENQVVRQEVLPPFLCFYTIQIFENNIPCRHFAASSVVIADE